MENGDYPVCKSEVKGRMVTTLSVSLRSKGENVRGKQSHSVYTPKGQCMRVCLMGIEFKSIL